MPTQFPIDLWRLPSAGIELNGLPPRLVSHQATLDTAYEMYRGDPHAMYKAAAARLALIENDAGGVPTHPLGPLPTGWKGLDGLLDHRRSGSLKEGEIISFPSPIGPLTIRSQFPVSGEGHCYRALNGSSQEVVLKIVRIPNSCTVEEWNEKLSALFLSVNRVLQTDFRTFPVNPFHLAIVNRYTPGRDLEEEVIHRNTVFSEAETAECLAQVLEDLDRLHRENFVHQDIKPRNILKTPDGRSVLIDFGLAREADPASLTATRTQRGTLSYSNPRLLRQPAGDLYSLARTAYFLLTGKHPPYISDESFQERWDRELFVPLSISPAFRTILMKMLQYDGKYRDCAEVLRDLKTLSAKQSLLGAKGPAPSDQVLALSSGVSPSLEVTPDHPVRKSSDIELELLSLLGSGPFGNESIEGFAQVMAKLYQADISYWDARLIFELLGSRRKKAIRIQEQNLRGMLRQLRGELGEPVGKEKPTSWDGLEALGTALERMGFMASGGDTDNGFSVSSYDHDIHTMFYSSVLMLSACGLIASKAGTGIAALVLLPCILAALIKYRFFTKYSCDINLTFSYTDTLASLAETLEALPATSLHLLPKAMRAVWRETNNPRQLLEKAVAHLPQLLGDGKI